MDRSSEALKLLDAAVKKEEFLVLSPAPASLASQEQKWTEQFLFLWARLSPFKAPSTTMKQTPSELYIAFTGLLPPSVLTTRRIRIYRGLFGTGEGVALTQTGRDIFLAPLLMRPHTKETDSLRSHIASYQTLLRQLVDLSKGVGQSALDRSRSEKLLESYDWLFVAESMVTENETPEEAIHRHLRLIEV
jgi:hypothetical protein